VLPKSYRSILNAANDRFWNCNGYVADDNGTPLDKTDDTGGQAGPQRLRRPQNTRWCSRRRSQRIDQRTGLHPIGNEGGFLLRPVVRWTASRDHLDHRPDAVRCRNVDLATRCCSPRLRGPDVIVDFSEVPRARP